ncbi:helix-turn-helix domain-containing protein [Apilactobacillus apisilvae]|uniref:Helix-turn-helix domain-containing protein n=1 Tax=Apilactobacillus apisilvae TaxID=2923364 RepID=A0ABY4PJ93_9LACO|nr:helix-turn-helix domain-containing protein [Apilactobacillus apisilvae]UQS85422.1 helix-turn-helix domain-containing protein [Apilactobacillus apisilvae]
MNDDLMIVLLSISQPRRTKLIDNLLMGKKTVSTLFWGNQYGLLKYSGIFKGINIDSEKTVNSLIHDGYVKNYDKYQFLLTKKGNAKKDSIIESFYFPKELSSQYYYDVFTFQERFLLLIQVISEYSYQNVNYYPLQTNFENTNLIKSFFHDFKQQHIVEFIYKLITQFLQSVDEDKANLFANLLIGHDNYGLTDDQLKSHYQISLVETYFIKYDLWILLIKFISIRKDGLSKFLLKNIVKSRISNSANNTLKYFNEDYSLSYISNQNNIKISTVKEHLLENAIILSKEQFPYTKLLSNEDIKLLNFTYHGILVDDWQFIKVKGKIDFFAFRLYQILRSK